MGLGQTTQDDLVSVSKPLLVKEMARKEAVVRAPAFPTNDQSNRLYEMCLFHAYFDHGIYLTW